MVFIPFVYFLCLTNYLWRKHNKNFDISIYISLLYTFSSLCSIFIVCFNLLGEGGVLFKEENIKIEFIPTILYCLLLTLIILPFERFNKRNIKKIVLSSNRKFDIVVYFFLIVFLINLYLIADSTLDILKGDVLELRSAHYAGEETALQLKLTTLPNFMAYLYYLNRSTILLLPCFFYSLCFMNKPKWYNLMILLISLSVPLAAIQNVDRTEFVYYAQMFLFCFLVFKPFIQETQKKFIYKTIKILSVSFIFYIISISVARFSDRDSGTIGSGLQYAGQGFLNFCYFYEYANPSVSYYIDRAFPLMNHFFNNFDSTPEVRENKSAKHGFNISIFPTFLGDLIIDIGVLNTIVWVLLYDLICCVLFPRNNIKIISLGQIIIIFVFASIPIFGIFYYKYHYYLHSVMLLLSLYLGFIFHYKIKYR